MYPPLCFVDVTSGIVPNDSKSLLQNSINEEDYNLITCHSEDIKFKFKIVEFVNSSPLLTAFR